MNRGAILDLGATRGTGAEEQLAAVRSGLENAAASLRSRGIAVPEVDGKLIRPLLAYAMVPPEMRPLADQRFWSGAFAVQMVHEASLLHDDILDDADHRRGKETVVAERGVEAALVLGDHYLTGAYRAAAAVAAPAFLDTFIEAVERTVQGEVAQQRAVGRTLDMDEYCAVVRGKSGMLLGASAALGGARFGLGRHDERVALGQEFGVLYQQVDDLLDYCPDLDTGKPALQDYRQGKWTWVLGLAGVVSFDLEPAEVLRALFASTPHAPSPARRALAALAECRDDLLRRLDALSPGDTLAACVLDGWLSGARRGVEAQEEALAGSAKRPLRPSATPSVEARVRTSARSVGGPEAWPSYFARHARTFRFASRLFPEAEAALIRGVYAFCRFTDDLVDDPEDDAPPPVIEARLEVWSTLARHAFEGRRTDIPILDEVLGEAGRRGVSWIYPDALLAGVGMDLTRSRYPDWAALEAYTFGVAGAVGGWITQLFGIRDEALLARAHALGHGMQLTNIARDVGEDLDRDRVYLPAALLQAHDLDAAELRRLRASPGPLPRRYAALVSEVLDRADAFYEEAWPGIRALPSWYRRPVAVAAQAYRGIHREIRRNGYDNLRRRASTSARAKLVLAAGGLWRSRG